MENQLTPIPDLAYYVDPDNPWIDLEQSAGIGEVSRIVLHHIHLRLLFEEAGHLLPPPTADELAKRLARQLCDVLSDLADEAGTSPGVDRVIDRLTALVDLLPDALFQQDRDEALANDRPAFELTTAPSKEEIACSTRQPQR